MIDKSIRQHYQEGEKVGPFRRGMEMIMPKLKAQALPQEGKKLPNIIRAPLQRAALSKLGLGALNPILGLLSLLGIDPISWAGRKLTEGGAQQSFTAGMTGFGSPQEGRELRVLESRRADMLQRKEEDRNYSEKNLDMVTRAIAEAKGLDINNPNEMKNIDKPITQIQTARSITEAPQVIPPTPEVISPHLGEGIGVASPRTITPTGTGGSPSITSRSSAPTYRDPIMDMVTKQTYASPARPHGTQTERLETLLKDDPALGLYNLAKLKGFTGIVDPTERAKAKETTAGFFEPDTGMSYVRDLERLGTGDKTVDAELAATAGHELTHALFENDPRFASILEKINLSKPRGTLTEGKGYLYTGDPDIDQAMDKALAGEGYTSKSLIETLQKRAETYEQEELLTRLLDIQRYGDVAGSGWYLEESPYAISKHPSGEYGAKGLTKTLTPFANEFTTLAKQLTTPVTQDPDTGSAQIAERIAAENRAKAEADAAAAAARAYTPPVRHHTGGADNRNDPGGGRGQSPTGRDVAGTPFKKGGRVDKALGGRSRDI